MRSHRQRPRQLQQLFAGFMCGKPITRNRDEQGVGWYQLIPETVEFDD